MQKKKAVAILGIGSNIGHKISNLSTAVNRLKASNIFVLSTSKIYQTPAWGFESKEDFFNMAVKVETQLSPLQLLIEIKAIELQMGRLRKKSEAYTSRIIDIDIIDFNNETHNSPDLKVPHMYLQDRNFVLFPIRDVHPKYKHPETGEKIQDLIEKLNDGSITVVNIST